MLFVSRVRNENSSLEETLQVGVGRLQHMHLQLDELREQQSEGRALTLAEDFFKYASQYTSYIHTYIHTSIYRNNDDVSLLGRTRQSYGPLTGTALF